MKTPKEYRDNLLNHIITKQMLVDCLYSVNKRAKNYRDKEREQRAYSRCHRYVDNSAFIEGAREKKLEMYRMKDMLLQVLTPICIHKEFIGYKTERIYSYEIEEYKKYKKQFFYEGQYIDDDYSIVYFGDVELKDEPIYHYYLFYDLDCGHTFHTPIKKEELYRIYMRSLWSRKICLAFKRYRNNYSDKSKRSIGNMELLGWCYDKR